MNMDRYSEPIKGFALCKNAGDWIPRAVGDKVSLVALEDRPDVKRLLMKWLTDDKIIVNNNRGYNIMTLGSFDDWFYDSSANRLGIVENRTRSLIGFLGLEYSPCDMACELSITIGEESERGKGFGTDAVNVALRLCFDELNAQSCHLFVLTTNNSAIRCYEKCHFTNNGLYRGWGRYKGKPLDWYFMDIIRDEWEAFNNVPASG